jgi:diguanylate cyclase (GGDEF)-like protein
MEDDFILFSSEGDDTNPPRLVEPWIIGIIDDDPSVHQATLFALKSVIIQDRPLVFYSAFSGKEGFELVAKEPEMALIFLDVVMESQDAGLKLVERIRNEMGNKSIQIVLRTGQAGYAPEEKIIIDYEINSYKMKSELTRSKLFTTLATGLRSWQLLRTIEKSRNGLRSVIKSAASLIQERSVFEFSTGVLQQIDALFELSSESLFCVSQKPASGPHLMQAGKDSFYIVAASKKYHPYFGKDIATLKNKLPLLNLVDECLKKKHHVFAAGSSCLYLSTPSGWEGVIVAEKSEKLRNSDKELLKIFCLNVALGLENAKFFTYLNQAAFKDDLTGLSNRRGFLEHNFGLQYSTVPNCSLYLIDIDYFHLVIDSLGFELGNAILEKFASQIRKFFPAKAIIARLHADVFAVMTTQPDINAKDVASSISRPIIVEGQSIRLGVTVGSSHSLNTSLNSDVVEKLLQQAEMALKVAKEHLRGSGKRFDSKYEVESRHSMTILCNLRSSLDNNELYLVLQPKVDINTHKILGYEALIRWLHPEKGIIPPNAFIPAVEKSGLYYELDLYVANCLCKIIADNQLTIPISFNISANSLKHESFVNDLKDIFSKNRIDFKSVEIEVTENALIHSEQAISRLEELKNSGFRICLDDFGAGFSSLSYLVRLPLDVIKIDRAFVSDICSSPSSLVLIKGMIDIITNLGKDIVIEGVETEQQVAIIKELRVNCIQGYFYYRPMDVDSALSLISST